MQKRFHEKNTIKFTISSVSVKAADTIRRDTEKPFSMHSGARDFSVVNAKLDLYKQKKEQRGDTMMSKKQYQNLIRY